MRLISPTEATFVSQGIHQNIREDGRLRDQWRTFTIETDCLPQANGSARATVHHGSDVLVGIRLDLATPELATPQLGKIICSVDCSSSTRIDDYEGKSIREVNAELAEIVHRALNSSLDLQQLCVLAGNYCWFLYVDVVVLDYGGNLIDTLMMAVHGAIRSTPIPKVVVNRVEFDADPKATPEYSLEIDENEVSYLDTEGLPLFLTLYISSMPATKRQVDFFLDANQLEGLASSERIHFALDRSGSVYSIKNSGIGSLSFANFMTALKAAKEYSQQLFSKFDQVTGRMAK